MPPGFREHTSEAVEEPDDVGEVDTAVAVAVERRHGLL
jgi:hypothetical protein